VHEKKIKKSKRVRKAKEVLGEGKDGEMGWAVRKE